MELYNGRPEHTEGRLEKELRVYDLLDSLGVSYARVDHEAAMTMDACEEIDRTLSDGVEEGVSICKNLLLCNRQETDFYLLLIPGDKPFKTKYLTCSSATGRRRIFICCSFRGTSPLRRNICPPRSVPQGCPLPKRNIWKPIWISRPGRSA